MKIPRQMSSILDKAKYNDFVIHIVMFYQLASNTELANSNISMSILDLLVFQKNQIVKSAKSTPNNKVTNNCRAFYRS